jgi:hypothetical protein
MSLSLSKKPPHPYALLKAKTFYCLVVMADLRGFDLPDLQNERLQF